MKQPATRTTLTLLLCMPALVWTADLLAGTPALILAAATMPALLFATLILAAQRGEMRPRRALAFSLLWGAIVAAFLSTSGNELARTWMSAGDAARTAREVVLAPALEESAKALGLLVLLFLAPASWRNARDGIVYGALIGAGFVWTENFLYLGISMMQGGEEGLVRALYLRGILGGATHTVFTASSGAVLGWWISRDRRPGWLPAAGLGVAAAQHIGWNALAAPMIATALCGAATAGGACTEEPTGSALFGVATLVAAAFLAPGIALATIAWRSACLTAEPPSA